MEIVKTDAEVQEREGQADKIAQNPDFATHDPHGIIPSEGVFHMKKAEKLRVHVYLEEDNMEYVKVMARASGMSQTDFINAIIARHMGEHRRDYNAIRKRAERV